MSNIYLQILNSRTHSPLVSSVFLRLFPCLGVFWSSFLFLCHWISFLFFLYDRRIHSRDLLFLKVGEFQAWDWLWYPLSLWPQRRSRGAEISIHVSALAGI